MKGQNRDIIFSLLLVVVSGFLFFTLGLFASWKWGLGKQHYVVEYVPTESTESTTATTVAGKVDLNQATVEDLMQIDGIGEKTAQKIIAYRSLIGQYTFIEQLLDVEGIGEKKLEGWKHYLTVEGGATTSTSTTALKINLNTATKSELMQVDGIGEQTALKIVAYREQHGAFTTVEQLKEIDGIGEKKFEAWKTYFVIE